MTNTINVGTKVKLKHSIFHNVTGRDIKVNTEGKVLAIQEGTGMLLIKWKGFSYPKATDPHLVLS